MRRYILAATSATSAAVAALALFAGTAAAQPADEPVSGDDRATAHSGNVVNKDCAELFPGSSAIGAGDLSHSVDGTNTYLDITAIAGGADVVAVIVKGGPAYNVYEAADLGDLAWLDLHSPRVPSGKPAQISHWFACGGKETTTTTATTTTTTGTGTETTTTSTTDTSTPPNSSTPGSGAATVTTTTTPADVAAAAAEDDLASTGFNGGWLVVLAAILLLAGGGLLLVRRPRTTRS
jgi:LPXTG-motif cell wall-anchored protein